MSRVSKKSAQTTEEVEAAPAINMMPADDEVDTTTMATNPGKQTRILFEARGTAEDFASGLVVNLGNADAVFGSENTTRGIISKITMRSAYSDCSEPVTVSMNLFNNSSEELPVQNKHGWLHAPQNTDFGTKMVGGSNGFKNVSTLLPYANSYSAVEVYNPEDAINSRYLSQYGHCTRESLRENIVPFKNDGYYLVDENHVVLNVIKANWDSLGIDVDNEPKFNGRYIQIPCNIFDRVCDDLEQQVLAKMPFTDLKNLKCRFSTKKAKEFSTENAADATYHAVVELQLHYQFPPESKDVSV
jgi:hypothetical protein